MILNLTQHPATPEQIAQGVVDLDEDSRKVLAELLTFDADMLASNPDCATDIVNERAADIARLFALDRPAAMIGGAPYLMAHLEQALRDVDCTPMYALSDRVSAEQVQPDGSVRKVNVFRHVGFLRAAK